MREFYSKPYFGHPRYQNTLTTIKKFYYWPNLKKEVANFIIGCVKFQQDKKERKHLEGLLQPIPIPDWKWELISMDFVTSLLRTSKQHDAIMVVIYKLSKVAHFVVVKSTSSASEVA